MKCCFCLLSWAHEYWGRYTLVSTESAVSLQSLHDSGDKAMRALFPVSPSEVLGSMDSLSQQENKQEVEANLCPEVQPTMVVDTQLTPIPRTPSPALHPKNAHSVSPLGQENQAAEAS